MHNRQPSWERKELPNISTQTIQSPPPVSPTHPSAPRDFQEESPGTWSPRGVSPTPGASAHPGSQQRVHDIPTEPPARFLTPLDIRTCPCSSWRGESRPREAGGTPQLSTEHPQTQPGEQKEEGGGLPLEGRLCLVCRDEKVPMTAPMAVKTCVRLGTPRPAPPLPWKEISVAPLLRIGGGKKKKNKKTQQNTRQLACSLVFSERGAGALGAFSFLLQPAHALTHRASRSRRAFGTGPGRFARQGPRTLPRSPLGAGHGPRLPSQRRVRCGSRAQPAPAAARSAPLPALGWLSGAGYQS